MSAVSIEGVPVSSQRKGGSRQEVARPTTARPSAFRVRFAVFVAALAFVVGALYALCVPVGAGPDEPMHVARVEQLAEGQLLPLVVDTNDLDTTLVAPTSDRYVAYGGETDAALYELLVQGDLTYSGIAAGLDSEDLAFPTWEDARLSTDAEMGGGGDGLLGLSQCRHQLAG